MEETGKAAAATGVALAEATETGEAAMGEVAPVAAEMVSEEEGTARVGWEAEGTDSAAVEMEVVLVEAAEADSAGEDSAAGSAAGSEADSEAGLVAEAKAVAAWEWAAGEVDLGEEDWEEAREACVVEWAAAAAVAPARPRGPTPARDGRSRPLPEFETSVPAWGYQR